MFGIKKKNHLKIVKNPLPVLTFDLIKDEVKTKINQILKEDPYHQNKSYALSEYLYGIHGWKVFGPYIPAIVIVENKTGVIVTYALKTLIPDLDKRYRMTDD